MNITRKFLLSVLLLPLLVSACGGLTRSDKPATKTWWLKPLTGISQASALARVTRVDLSVRVVPGLDSDRILTLSSAAELNHYGAARWADNLPELMASLIGRTLQATGSFFVVSGSAVGARPDCDLDLEVREFFSEIGPAGQSFAVKVGLDGQYLCRSATPVAIHIQASVPIQAERMSSIVAAFQQGVDMAMRDLLEQLEL